MAYVDVSPKPAHPSRSPSGAMVSVKAASLLHHPHLWGLGLGSFALGLVNGALVISAGVGWVAYKQLLSLSPQQWAALRQQIEQALPLPRSLRQQALVLSLLLGTSTYTMAALWQATHSMLMAGVLLGQTTLTLFIVGLLLRSGKPATAVRRGEPPRKLSGQRPIEVTASIDSSPPRAQLDPIDHNLELLSHPEPLQRLVAVRRLVKLVDAMGDDRLYAAGVNLSLRSHLMDCFHVMLAHEAEPIVRTAVREGLTLLRQPHQLPEGPPPLPSRQLAAKAGAANPSLAEPAPAHSVSPAPASAEHVGPKPRQGHRTTVEYVEYLEP